MIPAPQRQCGGKGRSRHVAHNDPRRTVAVGLDFTLPRPMGRIVGNRARRSYLEILEPSPFDARIAHIEEENHGAQSRRSDLRKAMGVRPRAGEWVRVVG